MAPDFARSLVDRVKSRVRKSQTGILDGAKGKYVRRGGNTYLVVSVGRREVILSDVRTPVRQTFKARKDAFLSRKVEVLDNQ